jgi:hypothetical protein
MTTVIITVRGGCVQDVLSNDTDIRFVVLDEDSLDNELKINNGVFAGTYCAPPWVSHPEFVSEGEINNLINIIENEI